MDFLNSVVNFANSVGTKIKSVQTAVTPVFQAASSITSIFRKPKATTTLPSINTNPQTNDFVSREAPNANNLALRDAVANSISNADPNKDNTMKMILYGLAAVVLLVIVLKK